jgi:hypothetical protein
MESTWIKTAISFLTFLCAATAIAAPWDPPVSGTVDLVGQDRFRLVTAWPIRINRFSSYCIGSDVLRNNLPGVELMTDVRITMNAESVSVHHGNNLTVTDRPSGGRRLDQNLVELPYNPNEVTVMLDRTRNDICFSSDSDGILKDIEISYRLNLNGPGWPPSPIDPPINPPFPPPPPQPVSEVRGRLEQVSQRGDVTGWACDLRSSRSTEVVLYVDGRREDDETANLSTHSGSGEMGNPTSYGCDSDSGYRFHLDPDRYAGRSVSVEVRAISSVTNSETSIGSDRISFPLYEIERGIFTVGRDIFFSDGTSASTYCHISTMDQVRIIGKYGYSNRSVSSRPTRMSERGVCELWKIPEGLFMQRGGSPHIYYSNGNDAFCRLTTMEQVGGRPYERLVDDLPSNMRNDGDCR